MVLTLLVSGVVCLAILGVSLAVGYFPAKVLGLLKDSEHSVDGFLFDSTSQYVLGYGTLGFILYYTYLFNVPRHTSNIAIIVISVLCCAFAVKNTYHVRLFKIIQTVVSSARSLNEVHLFRFYYVIGFLLVVIYIPKVFVPWYDHDEMAVYGYMAKLIGNGWSNQDIMQSEKGAIIPWREMMVQSLDGLIFYLTGSTLAARVIRLMNLICLGVALFTFLQSLGVARRYCAAAFCGLLSIHELAWLGISLKADSTTMVFEGFGILVLARSFLADDATSGLRWSALGVAFSSFAIASRMSSLFLLALCMARFLYMIYKARYLHNMLLSAKIVPLAFVSIGAISYIINWLEYKNPLHPFSAPLFNSGIHAASLDTWRAYYNVDLPSPLLQLYLIFHMALGLEVHPMFARLLENFLGVSLPRASMPSMGWLSPTLLVVFLAPLYLSVRLIRVLTFEFIFLLLMWSFGIHYSRVFLAASLIPILICVIIMAAGWPYSKTKAYIARGLRYAFPLMILALFYYHATQMIGIGDRGPWYYISLPDKEAIFESNQRRLSNYLNQGDNSDLSPGDRDQIDKVLMTADKPVILTATTIGRVIQILFHDGYFRDMPCGDPKATSTEISDCLRSARASFALVKRDSRLFDSDPRLKLILANVFPSVLYNSENGIWELRAKNRQ